MNARALAFAHLKAKRKKESQGRPRRTTRRHLQHAVGPALDQIPAGCELKRDPVAAILPEL
jgi:hypothetical protein